MADIQSILALTRSYNTTDALAICTWQKSGTTRISVEDDGEVRLPNATATGQGILLGGDVELYRSDANVLTIPDSLIIDSITFTTTNPTIIAPISDDSFLYLQARDNAVGMVEIARLVGGIDPYFRIGRNDTGVSLNTVTDMLVLQAGGGTNNEAANFGLGMAVYLGNAASEVEKRGYLNWVLTTDTNGAEVTRLDIGVMNNGALALPISISGGAGITVNSSFGLLLANGSINFDTTATGIICLAADTGSIDFITRKATGGVTNATVARIQNLLGAGNANAGYFEGTRGISLPEMTAPAAIVNNAYLFAQDNGGGKTQLMVQMPTGAAIQIAIEL